MTVKQKQEFGATLTEARMKAGVTQRDCAFHCGVSIVAYQNWEHGICEPKPEKFDLICNFLSIDKEAFE